MRRSLIVSSIASNELTARARRRSTDNVLLEGIPAYIRSDNALRWSLRCRAVTGRSRHKELLHRARIAVGGRLLQHLSPAFGTGLKTARAAHHGVRFAQSRADT